MEATRRAVSRTTAFHRNMICLEVMSRPVMRIPNWKFLYIAPGLTILFLAGGAHPGPAQEATVQQTIPLIG